jgi:hypothetical protein
VTPAITPCARCASPLEPSDLRCAICALPAPSVRADPSRVHADILRCDGCGAAVSYDVKVQAPRCAFCGDVMHVERPEDPLEEAEAYLPFLVEPTNAEAALRGWMAKRGFFCPSDLVQSATVESLKPLWFVGWVFECDALVSWTADSNAGARRSAWAPHAGQSPLRLESILVSASRGLADAEVAELTPSFDLASARPEPHAMNGATIERFDVQRSTARGIVARAVDAAAARSAQQWVPGSRIRNLHTSVLIRSLGTRRLAFPSFVLAYRYRERLFRVVVHGQHADRIVGDSPISIAKVAAVVLGVALIIALAVVLLATTR